MNDNKKRIDNLRFQIEQLSPKITEAVNNLNEKSSFAEKFAAMFNNNNLENRKHELAKLISIQQENELELHITGDEIGNGSAPADTVADMITKFQKMLRHINISGKVNDSIKQATQLRLIAFEPGSFIVRLSGPTIDDGLFDNDITANNCRLFNQTMHNLFSILSNPDSDRKITEVKSRGSKFLRAYYDYVYTANKHNINIDTTWFTKTGAITSKMTVEQSKLIANKINQLPIELTTNRCSGIFIAIDAIKKTFTFKSLSDFTTFNGTYDNYVLAKLKEYKISPFDNHRYEITVEISTDLLKQKSTYKLLDLTSKTDVSEKF